MIASIIKNLRYALFIVLAVGAASPASAWLHGSPASLSLRVESAYDDNRGGVAADKEENFDIKIQPRVGLTYDWGRTYLNAFYMPYLIWRSNALEDQRDTDVYHELGGSVRHEITPTMTLNVSDHFSLSDEPRIVEEGVSVRENATYIENILNVDLDHEISPVMMLSVGGFNTIKRYEKRQWNAQEKDKYGVLVGLRRELDVMLNAMANVRYDRSKYHGETDHGAEYVFASLGVEKIFSPKLAGQVNFGWNRANYNEVSGSKDMPAGNARVVVSPSPDTSLQFGVRYELTDSDSEAYSTQERSSYTATLNHHLTPRLVSGITLMYASGEYKGRTATRTDAEFPGGSDDLSAVQASAVYRLTRNIDLEASYQFEDWDSDIRGSFTRNRAVIAVRAAL